MNSTPGLLKRLAPDLKSQLMDGVERGLKSIPFVRRQLDKRYDQLMTDLEADLHPYRGQVDAHPRLPQHGIERGRLLDEMALLSSRERDRWADGFTSGAVYHGNTDHIDFLNRVYALNSQSNPLHADLWPSAIKYEAEIVSMTAGMLGADALDLQAQKSSAPGKDALGEFSASVCGTVTSGGTESILLAMKTYRDWARERKGIQKPELIIPITAHAAFEKAGHYFGIKLVRIPLGPDFNVDVDAVRRSINKNTIALVGSAPAFPHGIIDPISELSDLALEHGVGLHVDACLGGFVLPWAERLGAPVPPFDFRLSGVTSMSADTHKYGYAAKGTSVVLYRSPELRRFQYYTATDWPGGLYYSPTLAGSRPGALSATCWAAMVATGEDGYMQATAAILAAAGYIRTWIEQIPELTILGDPLWVIAFGSNSLDIYKVLEQMSKRGWSLNGLHRPPAIHIAVTLRHTEPGVAQRFIEDLRDSVDYVKQNPKESSGMAPVYGMAANMPVRGFVGDILTRYVDLLYQVG